MKKITNIKNQSKVRNKINISYPFITSYPHHAMLYSLLSSNEYYYPAYFNHYIQLVYYKRERLDFNISFNIVEFLNNIPAVKCNKIERLLLKEMNIDTIEVIKCAIDNGYCVFMLIDLYNIEQCKTYYHKEHYYHDAMLYGYDMEKNILLIGEFFDEKKYSFYEVDINKLLDDSIEFFDWLGGIRFYKINEEPYGAFSINLDMIKNELENYINSTASNYISLKDKMSRNDDYVYGINIYNELIEVCNYLIKENTNEEYDLRTIHVLLEHKKVLLCLIKELYNNNSLNNAYVYYYQVIEVEKILRLTMNLIIKFNITGNKSLLNKVKERFVEIREIEESFFNKMISDIGCVKNISFPKDKIEIIDVLKYVNDQYFFSFYGNKILIKCKKKVCMNIFVDGKFVLQNNESEDIIIDNMESSYHSVEIISDINLFEYIDIDTECSKINCKNSSVELEQLSQIDTELTYGKDGKIVYGDIYEYPFYLGGIKYSQAYLVILSKISKDKRAIKKKQELIGTEAYILNSDYFEVYMRICGSEKRKITMYFSDYEYLGRKICIECYTIESDRLVEKTDVIDLKNSIYITFEVYGDVKFKIIKVEGPDATLSAIYFD